MQAMRPEVQSSAAVQRVLCMRTALAGGNWVAFFKAVHKGPYLLACAAHSYFRSIRAGAMVAMGIGKLALSQISCTFFSRCRCNR